VDSLADSAAARVSVHGGHSAQFCSHAQDRLADILEAYCAAGFAWIGITEHMPPARDAMMPSDDRAAGLDFEAVQDRFRQYFETLRALQRDMADRIQIFAAFEAEAYRDSDAFLADLIEEFRPDYIVGSIHHVHEILIDDTPEKFAEAAARSGGIVPLYCDYFDHQYALVRDFDPAVVGHFDLIRLLDPDYAQHLAHPKVWERIERNLALIGERGAILDFNVRALSKGQSEPYVSRPILARARELGIALVPGDDSHAVSGVGVGVDEGIDRLVAAGFDTDWKRPA
jgi:histidinol-phosphatase (PHP family)